MKDKFGIVQSRPLADFLPTLTIAAKNLATEMTNHNVQQANLHGEMPITREHVQNNTSVRQMLNQRGIKPEHLQSKAVASFWAGYDRLPIELRKIADKQYRLWFENPSHPSIQFKKVGRYWSARITDDYRAVGVKMTIRLFGSGSALMPSMTGS